MYLPQIAWKKETDKVGYASKTAQQGYFQTWFTSSLMEHEISDGAKQPS